MGSTGSTRWRAGQVWLAGIVMLFLGMLLGAVLPRVASRALRAVQPAPLAEPLHPYGLPEDVVGSLALVVLAGQSNMSGWGALDGDDRTDPRAFVFSNDFRWRLAHDPLDDPTNQVDTVSIDHGAGVGPGLAFALDLLERRPEMRIGLIPCAKGASSILQWGRNLSDQSLYGSCIKRIRAASTAGQLAAVLFYQGEADAVDPVLDPVRQPAGADYVTQFEQFVSDFRSDANAPSVPFVFAQLATQTAPITFVHWDLIKEQQARASIPCSAMIVTDDLPLMDGVHLSTPAYREVGARFAAALDGLMGKGEGC